MPRLNHKKARTGCQRCKARKVKCDEGKPKCAACARHNVPCEYIEPSPRRSDAQQLLPTVQHAQRSDSYTYPLPPAATSDVIAIDPRLELRLMHQWTAYTFETFSPSSDFWRYQAPVLALEHRIILDAMLALAALHASRHPPDQWISLDGRTMSREASSHPPDDITHDVNNQWPESEDPTAIANAARNHPDSLASRRSRDMLLSSQKYFHNTIAVHTTEVHNLTRENVEAVYLASVLVSCHALFSLNEPDPDPALGLPALTPLLWTRLSDATQYLCDVWRSWVGDEWLETADIFFGRPRLQEAQELFEIEQGKPFEALLNFSDEAETISSEDKFVYQQAVACLAFIYKSVTEGSEAPVVNCRRLVAMPSQLSRRFCQLLDEGSPRAYAVLAYMFAIMKLLSDKVFWFRGIAECQVPKLATAAPPAWKEVMKWPLDIAQTAEMAKIEGNSNEQDIRDILSL